MKIGDHVRLADRTAAQMTKRHNWRSTVQINWTTRTGTVVKIASHTGFAKTSAHGNDEVGVQWEGRSSLDWWKEKLLTVIEP